MRRTLTLLAILALSLPAAAATDRTFTASDGTRLHYIESGPPTARTLVLVPGWTMPAWIFTPQIEAFARHYHVIAFDPRGQGDSEVPATGYEPVRRGRDITELLAHLKTQPAVVIAWSLGVLDTLAAIRTAGDRQIAALVLVDNSIGEEPAPPAPKPPPAKPGPPQDHATTMRAFVAHMFRKPRPQAYLDKLTQATLRTPEPAAKLLLAYPVPRTYWREAVYATSRPVLYAIRPRWLPQAQNLLQKRPNTEVEVFEDAGHALFIDEAQKFNATVERFLKNRVWP
jgi:microsomal epoxide hydrolase